MTWHGPGQSVAYAICDLRPGPAGARVRGGDGRGDGATRPRCRARRPATTRWGSTSRGRKLGSVGIRVREGITTHGLALNRDPDLDWFRLMTACGAPGVEATSIAAEGGDPDRGAGRRGRWRTGWPTRLGLRSGEAVARRPGRACPPRGPPPRGPVTGSAGCARPSGRRQHLLGDALLDDHALVHEEDAVADLAGEAHLVGDDHHRHAALRERAHHLEDVLHQLGVEGAGDLVEQHRLGLHGERPRDRHPLLLAARQARGVLGGLVGQAHPLAAAPGPTRAPRPVSWPRTVMGASATLSSTVRCGKRLNDWKTIPIAGAARRPRRRAR